MITTAELPATTLVSIALVALFAGSLGAAMGIGGGLVLVPILITLFSIDTEHARAASLISVAVTSMAGSLVYLKERAVDLVVGSYLQLPTAAGAVIGALVGTSIDPDLVRVLFAALLVFVAARLWVHTWRDKVANQSEVVRDSNGSVSTKAWLLAGASCVGAGFVSSLLGVGGGIIFVPVLALMLFKSARHASATSTYLIGLTGAASALIYVRALTREGDDPTLVAVAIPAALGIFLGAQIGARLSRHIAGHALRIAFCFLMIINAGMLVWKVIYG